MPSSATENAPAGAVGAPEFLPLGICDVRHETREAIAVTFAVPPELREIFRFIQGQHLVLRAWIGGEEIRRSYSICSAIQDASLRIAIKRIPGGLFSNWAHDHLKAGMTIDVMGPKGNFNLLLAEASRTHYAAFAVGVGITPVLSIVKSTLLAEPGSRFTLFYGNRSSGAVMFREELAGLKDSFLSRFNLVHVMTREHQDLDLLNGRITPERGEQLLRTFSPLETVDGVFVCCPRDTALGIREKLRALGFAPEKIKVELFHAGNPGSSRIPAAGEPSAEGCEVSVVFDGRTRIFTMEKGKETVLDAALRSGIELRYSCKSGVCSTCRCKLTEGQVDMDASYALESYEVDRGFILACQSYPTTPRITVDFDHAE